MQHAGAAGDDDARRTVMCTQIAARLKLAIGVDVKVKAEDKNVLDVPSGAPDGEWDEVTEAREVEAARLLLRRRRERPRAAASAAAAPVRLNVDEHLVDGTTYAERAETCRTGCGVESPAGASTSPASIGKRIVLWEVDVEWRGRVIDPPIVSVRGQAVADDVVKNTPVVYNTRSLKPGDMVWVVHAGCAFVAVVDKVTLELVESAEGAPTVGEERQYSALTPRRRAARGGDAPSALDLDRTLLLANALRTRTVVDPVEVKTITEAQLRAALPLVARAVEADVAPALKLLETLGESADTVPKADRKRASQNGRVSLIVVTACGDDVAAEVTLQDAPVSPAPTGATPIATIAFDNAVVRVLRRVEPRRVMEAAPVVNPSSLRSNRHFALVEAAYRELLGCTRVATSVASTRRAGDRELVSDWASSRSNSLTALKVRLHPSPTTVAELVAAQTLTRGAALQDPANAARVVLEELESNALTHDEHLAHWALDVQRARTPIGAFTVKRDAVQRHTRRWHAHADTYEPVYESDASRRRATLTGYPMNEDVRIVLFEVHGPAGSRIETASVLRGDFPPSVRDPYLLPRFNDDIATASAANVPLAIVRGDPAPSLALSLSLSLSLSPAPRASRPLTNTRRAPLQSSHSWPNSSKQSTRKARTQVSVARPRARRVCIRCECSAK